MPDITDFTPPTEEEHDALAKEVDERLRSIFDLYGASINEEAQQKFALATVIDVVLEMYASSKGWTVEEVRREVDMRTLRRVKEFVTETEQDIRQHAMRSRIVTPNAGGRITIPKMEG
jgi:hypothetical protein